MEINIYLVRIKEYNEKTFLNFYYLDNLKIIK